MSEADGSELFLDTSLDSFEGFPDNSVLNMSVKEKHIELKNVEVESGELSGSDEHAGAQAGAECTGSPTDTKSTVFPYRTNTTFFTPSHPTQSGMKPQSHTGTKPKTSTVGQISTSHQQGSQLIHTIRKAPDVHRPFDGRFVNLSTWFDSAEKIAAQQGCFDDVSKIQAALSLIDRKLPDNPATSVAMWQDVKCCTDWEEFKRYFIVACSGGRTTGLLESIAKMTEIPFNSEISEYQYMQRLEEQASEIRDAYRNSAWRSTLERNIHSDAHIEILIKMIMIPCVLKQLPLSTRRRLKPEILAPNVPLPDFFNSTMAKGGWKGQSQAVMAVREYDSKDKPRKEFKQKNDKQTVVEVKTKSVDDSTVICFSCGQIGHKANKCPRKVAKPPAKSEEKPVVKKWCAYHKRLGHATEDCFTLLKRRAASTADNKSGTQ